MCPAQCSVSSFLVPIGGSAGDSRGRESLVSRHGGVDLSSMVPGLVFWSPA